MTLGPITHGKDFNYFAELAITETDFPNDAQAVMNFKGARTFTLTNEGSAVITYSFNGNTVHGTLTNDTPTEHLKFENRNVVKIWFKVASGSHSVRVEAWGI